MYTIESHPGILNEIIFNTSKSGGPGGQNVNKVSSKVELRFKIQESNVITENDKQVLFQKLANKINNEGALLLTSQESRSQLENKEIVIDKFFKLINSTLIPRKKRKPTKPTYAAKLRRLKAKKIDSEKKATRKFRPES